MNTILGKIHQSIWCLNSSIALNSPFSKDILTRVYESSIFLFFLFTSTNKCENTHTFFTLNFDMKFRTRYKKWHNLYCLFLFEWIINIINYFHLSIVNSTERKVSVNSSGEIQTLIKFRHLSVLTRNALVPNSFLSVRATCVQIMHHFCLHFWSTKKIM